MCKLLGCFSVQQKLRITQASAYVSGKALVATYCTCIILYSGLCLRGPNLCELREVSWACKF